MRVSILQMNVRSGNVDENVRKVEKMMEEVVREEHPDVVVLPEMWNIGFLAKKAAEYVEGQRERLCPWMSELAQKYGVYLVGGSIANERSGHLFNTAYVFDRDGVMLTEYDKVHLFSPAKEEKYFSSGDTLPTFLIEGRKAAVVICYDIRFCEFIRTAVLEGIEMLFVVASWPHPRQDHWEILLKARAIENQIFVIAANMTGHIGKTVFCGHSVVLDPWGQVLASRGEAEGVLTADMPVMLRDEAKKKINVLADRRPDLYHL